MRIKMNSSDEFISFRNGEIEKAKATISEDIDELRQLNFKVKHFPTDFDDYNLVVESSPISYDGILPTIIELFSRKKNKRNAIRLEKNKKICALELHIKSEASNSNKIIRYFILRYRKSKGHYIVKLCNNMVYNIFVTSLIKKANKHGKEYALKDHLNEFFLRCCFHKRFGKQAFVFRGKDYSLLVFVAFFLLVLAILTFIWIYRYR